VSTLVPPWSDRSTLEHCTPSSLINLGKPCPRTFLPAKWRRHEKAAERLAAQTAKLRRVPW
jgi:hypothetical protein